jgi:hypothetical protein
MSSSIMYHDLITYSARAAFCNVQNPSIATDHLIPVSSLAGDKYSEGMSFRASWIATR